MQALKQASSPVVLVPAYGRKYSSAESALQDWNSGRDFKILNGSYCSIRDIKVLADNASTVWIRYFVDDMVRIA